MDIVYQQIWDADMAGNGLPALRPGETKDPARGYVVVNEPTEHVGPDYRVLAEVHIPEEKAQTYRLCHALMNNYALERRAREVLRPQELEEETAFIEAILDTPVMQLTRQVLEERGGVPVPREFLVARIRECWFDIGRSGSQAEASGFEHVFVGEQGGSASKIGGYHYWHKYWTDDGGAVIDGAPGVDRLLYRGTQYGGAARPDQGVLVPEVVTLSMEWDAPAGDGGAPRRLTKPIGGFFVGCSPEGLMALGLVRALTESGKIAHINGAEYQLDLHRLDNARGIRTFFPRFVKAHVVDISEPTDPQPPVDPVPSVEGGLRIVAAMVNPANPEGGREFLQIINTAASVVDMAGWTITAPNGTRFTLSAQALEPGEIFRFTVPRSDGILRNGGGTIALFAPDGALVQSCTYTAGDTRTEGAVLLF